MNNNKFRIWIIIIKMISDRWCIVYSIHTVNTQVAKNHLSKQLIFNDQ